MMLEYIRFLPRSVIKSGMPVQMIFFVTAKCNLRCRHCFYWRQIENSQGNNELKLEEIEKLSKNRLNLLWLSLTGGEPFLRKDIAQIAGLFYKNSKVLNISIPTNGQLKEGIVSGAETIAKNCPDAYLVIIFSFDGTEKTHDFIRGKNTFKTAVENFKAVKSIQKKHPNLGLAAQITCTADNYREIKTAYRYLQSELSPDNITLNLVRAEPKFPEQKNLDIRYYKELAQLLRLEIKEKNRLEGNSFLKKIIVTRNFLTYSLISRIYEQGRYPGTCFAPDLNMVISEEGDVYPCENFSFKLGNLRDFNYNLKELLSSKDAQEMKRNISRSRCFCTYECAMSANILFDPAHYPEMIKELLR